MSTTMKKFWTKIQEKHKSISTDLSNSNKYIPIAIELPDSNNRYSSISQEAHYPVFTVAIGLFDVFMLIVIYIVQGPVLTSDTWISMGCKYVPCMKPLHSKIEQQTYYPSLKAQCHEFLFPYQFFRFFIPIFLHSSISHLLSNLIYQALVGALLEDRRKYDIKTLGICYILFGFSGNIMSALWNPKSSKNRSREKKMMMIVSYVSILVSIGASGAVYGLLIFCMIDNSLRIFTITNIQDKIVQFLINLLVIPYFITSIFFDVDSSGYTDHAAHIGGALVGLFVAMLLCDMPAFILNFMPYGKRGIQILALTLIFAYISLTLCLFYLFTPIYLK